MKRLCLPALAVRCQTVGVLDIVFDDKTNLLALLDGRVMVQVRYGRLTLESLDVAAQKILPVMHAEPRAIGAIAVVNGDAGVAPPEVQARQKELIGGLLRRPNASMATVMFGDTIQATAMRAVGRVLMIGAKNIRHAKDVHEAVTWLSEKLGDITPLQLNDAVAALEARRKKP